MIPEHAPRSMPETQPAGSAGPAATARCPEDRLGLIVGDRVCAACGFNLHGQTIVREPHYAMLLVRCPECGRAAAVQEYPLLGRWANRWAAIIALAWLAVVLGAGVGTIAAMWGATIGSARYASFRLGARIAERQREFLLEQEAKARQTLENATPGSVVGAPPLNRNNAWVLQQEPGPEAWIEEKWWKSQDGAALVAELGGPFAALDPAAVRLVVPLALLGLAIGIVWSCLLPHVPRRRCGLVVLPLGTLAGLLYALVPDPDSSRGMSQAADVAASVIGRAGGWPAMGWIAMSAAAGSLVGRPIVRLALRLLLPPRLRASFGILWSCDGLPMPRPALGPRR
ncbi:MAG: hypothetical protein JNM07_13295 [Phycisphaerae bacterium]|nr:hypothetical protein [Phycisphaerae bacterium]